MFDEQKSLIEIAFGKKKSEKNGQKVYRHLVYKVFFDVLSKAYPLFYKDVDKKKFEKIVYEFMQYGAKNIKIWKMPNEFRTFVKKKKLFEEIPYVNELLWFEWIEIELMMKNYSEQEVEKFSYANKYRLSQSCVLKKLKYKIFEKGSFDKNSEYYLLGFYDFVNYRVIFREVSLPLYFLLKKMDKKGLEKAIKSIAKMSEQSKEEVETFFLDTLTELNNLQILRTL